MEAAGHNSIVAGFLSQKENWGALLGTCFIAFVAMVYLIGGIILPPLVMQTVPKDQLQQAAQEAAEPRLVFLRSVLGTVLIFAVSYALAELKRNNRFWYAWVEMISGAAICLGTLAQFKEVISPLALLALFTSLFLFTRSFENFDEASKEKEKKLNESADQVAKQEPTGIPKG